MRVVELCAGIGGLSRAVEAAGHEIVCHVEVDPFCQRILRKHWPNALLLSNLYDVTGSEYGPVDLLMGGIPCQGWSEAGKKQGVRDPRHLWPEMLRLVKLNRPTWVVIENVRGFISNGGYDLVATDLESEGYETEATLLSAYLSGSPQQRERVFVVAHTAGFRRYWPEALAAGYETYWQRHNGLPQRAQDSNPYHAQHPVAGHTTSPQDARGQRGVDSVSHGISSGLFRHRWPAGFGERQYAFEPTRSIERSLIDVAEAQVRMQALGNAVVSQQAYPVFEAINWLIEREKAERAA